MPKIMSVGFQHPCRRVAVPDETVDVLVTRLDVTDEATQSAFAILSESEKKRANRFVFPHDRRRFIVARAQLRYLLASRLESSAESIEFSYGAHDKPALAGEFQASRLSFNLSHCGDVAVYGFTYGKHIGIDVEQLRTLPDADDIAQRFFSQNEVSTYLQLSPQDRPRGFFNCWTRKEAFIKAIGEGLSHPLDTFDVSLRPGEPAAILQLDALPENESEWTIYDFEPVPGFIGAVVARKDKTQHFLPPSDLCVEKTATETRWKQSQTRSHEGSAS